MGRCGSLPAKPASAWLRPGSPGWLPSPPPASPTWTQLWWSRADGHATVLDAGSPATAGPVAQLVARYPQYQATPPTGPVIAITVTT